LKKGKNEGKRRYLFLNGDVHEREWERGKPYGNGKLNKKNQIFFTQNI
jgi:hypothetical protein